MSAPIPDIATYERRTASHGPLWLAKYVHCGDLLPATFEGATEAEAYNAACEFWASEQRAIAKARLARGEIAE